MKLSEIKTKILKLRFWETSRYWSGITAAPSTRLALDWTLVKRFKVYPWHVRKLDWFDKPFTVQPWNSLNSDMHGLIFKTRYNYKKASIKQLLRIENWSVNTPVGAGRMRQIVITTGAARSARARILKHPGASPESCTRPTQKTAKLPIAGPESTGASDTWTKPTIQRP